MVFSIVLLSSAILVYAFYGYFGHEQPQVILTLYVAIALFGVFLSIEAIFLNVAKLRSRDTTKSIIGLVLAILALVLFIIYLVARFTARIHAGGGTIF